MKEKFIVLKSEILQDQKKLNNLFDKFEKTYGSFLRSSDYAKLVESAFYVNQIYSGFERIFKNTAKTFENNIDDELWHKSLLERMSIEIESIRPAVITEKSFACLNELRAFRHFFRHAYDTDIDEEKFAIVAKRAKLLNASSIKDLKRFAAFLDELITVT